jgi:uncharacterized protein with GYD domain
MPHYMFQARYTSDAIKAMIDTPQDREAGARPLIEAMGAKLHSFFFCMGQDDVVAIIEAPDDETMAAASLIIGGSGAFSGGATTKLMTAPQAMSAMQKAQAGRASYKPATG